MPYIAFNQELAKVYNCINGLPTNAGEYNWICTSCFEFLYLIKYEVESNMNYYFLHEKDVKTFINKLENNFYRIWKPSKNIITSNIVENITI
ncbi:MAG: hypothetical protein JSV62_07110 [Promethearchaeota archaeon]|nr:MAG: hypothetical protein JSV62_07110 [Candidatus Lokiarchaeota archaeon]